MEPQDLDPLKKRWRAFLSGSRSLLPIVFADAAPIDLRIVGRMLFHAAFVGLAAGLLGAAFFAALEYLQAFLLEGLAGYVPLRAHGEQFAAREHRGTFRPWLLVLLPAVGGVFAGLLAHVVPEVRGGGADATIEAFHEREGVIRRRVISFKALASLATLATGGAGGREGPTMQIGGAIGSTVGRMLGVGARERRILLVAGVAAGVSAVFRTPLGAALLAVEMLYRDGFESDALIPSVLSSVVAYSVVIMIFGESTLFSHSARFPFVPAHLPLYALLSLLLAVLALGFLGVFKGSRSFFDKLPVPDWLKPAAGGLLVGIIATTAILVAGKRVAIEGQGLGILGGGYGAVQVAISGADWLPAGATAIWLLLGLSIAKLFACSITIGSGGSAGDFAPCLAIGGLFGGAFGRAAAMLLNDPRIDAGAFALVGMGAFYGGIAHVPLASLVLVCELAGNYDLLVPLMLALAVSFVLLRRRSLYDAQPPTLRDSPVHRDTFLLDVLRASTARDVMITDRPFVTFSPSASAKEIIERVGESTWQEVFPVVDESGALVGLVSAEAAHVLGAQPSIVRWTIVADVMRSPTSVIADDDLRLVTERLLASGLRELPVVDDAGRIIGFVDEAEIVKLHLRSEGTKA